MCEQLGADAYSYSANPCLLYYRSEVCEKLGADAYIGLPAELDEQAANLAMRRYAALRGRLRAERRS